MYHRKVEISEKMKNILDDTTHKEMSLEEEIEWIENQTHKYCFDRNLDKLKQELRLKKIKKIQDNEK